MFIIIDVINPSMEMIIAILFLSMGLLHGVLKYVIIRDAARDVFNGGGVPVMDFVIFVPLWLSVGGSSLLKHVDAYPFPFFGLVAYFLLAALFYGIMELEYKLGRPEVERQLAEIERRKAAEQDAPAEG